MTDTFDESEIMAMIAKATGTESDKDRLAGYIAADPGIPFRGWATYIGLGKGKFRIHEKVLVEACNRFFKRTGITTPLPMEVWRKEARSRLNKRIISGEPFYYTNLDLSEIFHLSAPNGKIFYGLFPRAMRKNIRDFFDYDYLHRLDSREQAWIHKFNEEYYNNRFWNNETDLHAYQDQKRNCYSNNNSRERDYYSVMKGCDAINSLQETGPKFINNFDPRATFMDQEDLEDGVYSIEDALIDHIDAQRFGDAMYEDTLNFEEDN